LPGTGGFVATIVMRSIISEDGDGRKLIVLDVFECRPHLKRKFHRCLTRENRARQIYQFSTAYKLLTLT